MNREINVRAISKSTDELYKIQIISKDGILSVRCGCPAGIHRMLCKHRIQLVGKDLSLFLEEDHLLIEEFYSWDEFKSLELVFKEHSSSITALDSEIKRIQKEVKSLKNKLGEMLNDGIRHI